MRTKITPTLILTALLFAAQASADGAQQKTVSDPVPQYDGGELYAMNCANCHGIYGEGDGAITPDLSVVLLDLRYLSARNQNQYPEDFVRRIVDGRETRAAHGPDGMPVWGAEFARGEGTSDAAEARVAAKVTALVQFLKELQIRE